MKTKLRYFSKGSLSGTLGANGGTGVQLREGSTIPRFLLRLAGLELIDRERCMVERRIRSANFCTRGEPSGMRKDPLQRRK